MKNIIYRNKHETCNFKIQKINNTVDSQLSEDRLTGLWVIRVQSGLNKN